MHEVFGVSYNTAMGVQGSLQTAFKLIPSLPGVRHSSLSLKRN